MVITRPNFNSILGTEIKSYGGSYPIPFSNHLSSTHNQLSDVLRNLVQFLRFKKREKHAWRSVTFGKSNTPSWMFFTFFKLYKWYQIAQNITYISGMFNPFVESLSMTRELGINLFYTTIPCLNSVKEFEASHKVPKKFWTHKVFDRLWLGVKI